MQKTVLNRLFLSELEDFVIQNGEKEYRAKQIFENIHKNFVTEIDDMSNLPKKFRQQLKDTSIIQQPRIVYTVKSLIDETQKFLIELEDENRIEAVYMKYKTHDTICISTQIGCRMSCRFCASTKETFVRNLSAEEMLGQVYEVSKTIHSKISNVVLMGIGEPLENYEEVVRFIRLLNDENGYHMSIRNITLSTCGLVDQMKRLADEKLGIHLTISLHNPFSEERMRIMPITKKYCVEDVLLAADYYFEKTKRRIGFEYTVIRGVNDSNKHLRELVKILKHRNCLLNLIELNPIREYDQKSGSMIQIEQMKEYLNRHGVNTTIRRRQGEDINGACGQLRINSLKGGVN